MENILPFLLARGAGGVAHGAHIGGFIAGLVIARVIDKRGLADSPPDYSGLTHNSSDRVTADIAGGRFADAARAYFALSAEESRRLLSPSDSIELGNWLLENGHPRGALVVFRRHLRDYPNGAGAAEAHVGAGTIQLRHLNQPTAAYQHFLEALDLAPSPATEAAARDGLAAIGNAQRSVLPLRW
jgi:hypothetical protein